jgi:hypothetical protein
MDILFSLLVAFVLFGAIGMLIGQTKGRPTAGLIFSMLLGPIGWLLIFLGPDVRKQRQARNRPRPRM